LASNTDVVQLQENPWGGIALKKWIVLVACLVLSVMAFAEFSLGVIAGDPSGLSARLGVSRNVSLDLAAAYSFLWGLKGFHVHADFVYVDPDLFRIQNTRIPVYLGGGVRYVGSGAGGDYLVSVRVPVGMMLPFYIQRAPFEFFLELAPTVDLLPQTGFTVSFGIGVRYRF